MEKTNNFLLIKAFIVKTTSKEPYYDRSLHENWLDNIATNFLVDKVKGYSKMFGIDEGLNIKIKSHKNRLGSPRQNLILNFNKNLLRLPPKIIDYAVAHELCQAITPCLLGNHRIGRAVQDYKKRKRMT
jgi:predicted metal-dependent hydrolase